MIHFTTLEMLFWISSTLILLFVCARLIWIIFEQNDSQSLTLIGYSENRVDDLKVHMEAKSDYRVEVTESKT